MTTEKVFGFALLGCGDMGMHLAQQGATIDGVRVVAGADVDADRRARFTETFEGAHAAATVGEALAQSGVDAVIVASPPFLHRELVEAAAAAGKHVFCEKPLAPTLADCDAIIAACARANVRLMTGQVLRYIQPFATVHDLVVKQRVIGKVFGMEMRRFGAGWGGGARSWRNEGAATGGMLMEINAHEMDLLRYISGEVTTVDARLGRYHHEAFDFADFAYVLFGMASGGAGSLHASLASALGSTEGMLHGTEGSLSYRWQSGAAITYARFGQEKPTEVTPQSTEEPYRRELREFVEAVHGGVEPTITGADGRKAVELALAAYTSSAQGRVVTLPLGVDQAAPAGGLPLITLKGRG